MSIQSLLLKKKLCRDQVLDTSYQATRPVVFRFRWRSFFKVCLPLMGELGGHLGHVTQAPWINFRSPIPLRLLMKFGFDRPIGFEGEDGWKCWRTDERRADDGCLTILSLKAQVSWNSMDLDCVGEVVDTVIKICKFYFRMMLYVKSSSYFTRDNNLLIGYYYRNKKMLKIWIFNSHG